MRLRNCLRSSLVGIALAGMSALVAGEDIREVTVSGGPMYMGWSDQDSAITCGLLVKAPTAAAARRKPVQALVLIDVSHPMQGEPLGSAKAAAKAVVDNLADGDLFGVISYSNFARTVFPLQPLTTSNRKLAQTAIDGMGDETERNLMVGIDKAVEEFARFKNQDALGRFMFLITNGNPTKGVADPQQIMQKTLSFAKDNGVVISTFGYKIESADFDEDLLMDMAYLTRGRAFFIQEHGDISRPVRLETERLAKSAVRRVEIEITPPGDSKVTWVDGAVFENNRLLIGEMRPGTEQFIIFELEGRPPRQKDCILSTYYLDTDEYSLRKKRDYLDIPLSKGAPTLSQEHAPRILAYDLQAFLAQYARKLVANRHEFTTVFRDRLLELERSNGQLNSDYLKKAIGDYKAFEGVLGNAAIEDELLVKQIKYDANKMLFGE